MNTLEKSRIVTRSFVILVLFAGAQGAIGQEKIGTEDLISRHLNSIGSDEFRSPERSRFAAGSTVVILKTGGSGQANGTAEVSSSQENFLLKADFDSAEFPFERISFLDNDLKVRQYSPGARSPIGQFLVRYEEVFSEGLFGGVLGSGWAFLHINDHRPKIKVEGREHIDGVELYKVSFKPRRASDLKIRLYFDPQKFRHVRTEYERVVVAQMGADPASSRSQRETRFSLVETFSDFTEIGGLTIPKRYELVYDVFKRENPIRIEWIFQFDRFAFNQPLDMEAFNAVGKQ